MRLSLHSFIFLILVLGICYPVPARAEGKNGKQLITFAQMGQPEIILHAPNDIWQTTITLPPSWQWDGKAELELVSAFPLPESSQLWIKINGTTFTPSIQSDGANTQIFDILTAPTAQIKLEIHFDDPNCRPDSLAQIIIRSESSLTIEYHEHPLDLRLTDFPSPFLSNTFTSVSTLLIVPDAPTVGELQAGLIVAATLGQLTGGQIDLDLTRISDITNEQRDQDHLVLVGHAASLPLLSQLILPIPVLGNDFLLPDRYEFEHTSQDDGVVQLSLSPYNPARAILTVSGATDAAVLHAAKALSTGSIFPNVLPDAAIVKNTQPPIASTKISPVQTFTELGYKWSTVNNVGEQALGYDFFVPAPVDENGVTLEIAYNHAAGLDAERSDSMVSINDKPIAKLKLNTTDETIVRQSIVIPRDALQPGRNHLNIQVRLVARDVCQTHQNDLWLSIWPESQLRLKLNTSRQSADLRDYPSTFISDPTLDSSAFILQRDDPSSWRNAAQIASYLGAQTPGRWINLHVFYAKELPNDAREKYNLIAIGQASQLPLIAEMGDTLPAPFDQYSNLPRSTGLFVTYRISYTDPVGYVQLIASPWNQDKTVLAVLGNTSQGVAWAADALIRPSSENGLHGNLAVLSFGRVILPPEQNQSESFFSGKNSSWFTTQRISWSLGITLIVILMLILVLMRSRRVKS